MSRPEALRVGEAGEGPRRTQPQEPVTLPPREGSSGVRPQPGAGPTGPPSGGTERSSPEPPALRPGRHLGNVVSIREEFSHHLQVALKAVQCSSTRVHPGKEVSWGHWHAAAEMGRGQQHPAPSVLRPEARMGVWAPPEAPDWGVGPTRTLPGLWGVSSCFSQLLLVPGGPGLEIGVHHSPA